jgi:hypothetical protein
MSNHTLWLAPHVARDNGVKQFHAHLNAQQSLIRGDFASLPAEKRERAIAAINAKNEQLLRLREVSSNDVQDDKFLTSFSVQYSNPEYIGLQLLPRASVPNISGLYAKYDESARMGVVDDSVTGRDGANEIDDGKRAKLPYVCEAHALKNVLDWVTMENQVAPLNEMLDLSLALNEQMALNREYRHATTMTTSGNYNSANVISIAAANRFNSAGGGDPIGVMQDMNSRLWMGRGPGYTLGWFSLEVYNVLAKHPQILDIVKYTVGGLVKPQALAEYFGWDGILVGRARYRTSNRGQTDVYSRFWGNNMGVARVAVTPSIRNASFGYTATWRQGNGPMGDRVRLWWDNEPFTDGGYVAQSANHEQNLIVANKAAVLVTTPIVPF